MALTCPRRSRLVIFTEDGTVLFPGSVCAPKRAEILRILRRRGLHNWNKQKNVLFAHDGKDSVWNNNREKLLLTLTTLENELKAVGTGM